jgi:hypothetical protein
VETRKTYRRYGKSGDPQLWLYDILMYEDYILTYDYQDKMEDIKYLEEGPKRPNVMAGRDCSFIDGTINKYIDSRQPLRSPRYFKLLCSDDNEVFIAKNNELLVLDKKTLGTNKTIQFQDITEDKKLDYMFCFDDKMYAIFRELNSPIMQLFSIDKQTDERKWLMDFDESEQTLINMDAEKILYTEGRKIICRELTSEYVGETLYEIKLKKNIVKNNVFEVAGDWLFIHNRGKKANPNELLYKINLKTKEVIEIK